MTSIFAAGRERRARHQHDASLVGQIGMRIVPVRLSGGTVHVGLRKKYPARECHAEVVTGGQRQRMTATRVGAGALLAGSAGAIIGGMAQKDLSKSWVVLVTPDETLHLELNGTAVHDGPQFAFHLEAEAARQEAEAGGGGAGGAPIG